MNSHGGCEWMITSGYSLIPMEVSLGQQCPDALPLDFLSGAPRHHFQLVGTSSLKFELTKDKKRARAYCEQQI